MTTFRETPGRTTPDFDVVNKAIPKWFKDNGPSVPWFLVLFRGVVAVFAPEFIALWYRVARSHDWGYWFARMPGSGWEHVTKQQWDDMLRDGMAEFDYTRWGRIARKGLAGRISQAAWNRNGREMERMGYRTYTDVLAAKEPRRDQPTAID